MPGLLGAVQRVPNRRMGVLFDRLMAPMRRGSRLRAETLAEADGQWALGRFHLGALQPAPQLSGPAGVRVLFHGDLHNEDELRTWLGCPSTAARVTTANALVAALYQREGPQAAARLKGAFCAAILDEAEGQLVLVTDLLGSYPLYWFHGPERFVFASELKSVLGDPAVPRVLDPRAVADYLQFGFVFGSRTLAESVQMLPAGSTLVYRWRDGACHTRRYRQLSDLFESVNGHEREGLERVAAAFAAAVGRARSGGHRIGLSLSGGLDTRAVLSALGSGAAEVSTYTLGVKGCADEVIARELARSAGTRHGFLELDERYLSEFLPNLARMVSLSDGMYLSHGLTEMLAIRLLEDADFSVLLRGHCGELAKASLAWPFHTDAQVWRMTQKDELIPYLLARIQYIGHSVILPELFTGEWFDQMRDGPRQSLDESIADARLSPPDLCSYLYLSEHHRRFTVASIELFRNLFEVRLPFADEEFLQALFALPAAWRTGTRIHRTLIAPHLLKVRNSNTGAPGNAGPLVETMLDKFNSLFKRLNVYGYRHYHNFDHWMKRQLLESVEAVLLNPATLERGMLRELTLRRLIGETRAGVADHGYLFQVLLILELWQRENLQ